VGTRRLQHSRYLTDKRAAFLQLFHDTPHITTEQAYLLTGAETATQQRAMRRFLKLLFEAGYLLRELLVVRQTSALPHFQYTYRLSKHGAKEVHGRSAAERSPFSLAHDAEITAFHIALKAYPERLWWKQCDLRKTVNPDAVFGLAPDSDTPASYFFLEVERSRQGHYRDGESGLIAKLRKYASYRRSAACRREFVHFDDFHVIVVLATAERQKNLLDVLTRVLPARFIWTTTEADYRSDICGPIFRTPSDYAYTAYSLRQRSDRVISAEESTLP
jgi:hypothetical protein